MSKVPFDPELTAVESALAGLVPARSHVDRDQLMFQAGLASTQAWGRSRWLWPAVAAALAVVACGEGVVLATRRPSVRVVVVREPVKSSEDQPAPVVILSHSPLPSSPVPDASAHTEPDALRLRRQILRFGVDELPERPPLLTHSSGETKPPVSPPLFPGVIRNPDYQKMIDSGGSS